MPTLPSQASRALLHTLRNIIGPEPLPEPLSPSLRQAEIHALAKRQGVIAIPVLYQTQNSSPPPGTVVGITLGSVAAFIFIIWLFSTLTNRNTKVSEREVIIERERRRSRSPRSKRSRRSEMESRSPRAERIVRQERIVRETSRPASRYGYGNGPDMVEVVEDDPSTVVSSIPRRDRRRSSNR